MASRDGAGYSAGRSVKKVLGSLYKSRIRSVYPGGTAGGTVDGKSMTNWCQDLYEASAPQILLYGRALGLSHSEAEDVLQDSFVVLMKREVPPEQPLNYCLRTFRNKALNYRRNLWRRL